MLGLEQSNMQNNLRNIILNTKGGAIYVPYKHTYPIKRTVSQGIRG